MREVQVVAWCDKCAEREKKVPAIHTTTISFGGEPGKAIDLCAQHEARMVTPLASLVAKFGVDERRKRKQSDEDETEALAPMPITAAAFQCPFCERGFAEKEPLRVHLIRVHDAPKASLTKCPDCKRTFQTPPQLGMHRKTAHGFDSLQNGIDAVRARLAKAG